MMSNFVSIDNEYDSSDDDRSTVVTVPSKPTPKAKKRKSVDRMNANELAEYEKEVMVRIKKRKAVLEAKKERTTLPTCPVCLNECENSVIASCKHLFCVKCYCSTLTRNVPEFIRDCHVCPLCRADWNEHNKLQFNFKKLTIAQCKELGAKC
jgi:hypothetical protein